MNKNISVHGLLVWLNNSELKHVGEYWTRKHRVVRRIHAMNKQMDGEETTGCTEPAKQRPTPGSIGGIN